MVRVAGIKAHQLQGIEERSQDGLTPTQQLASLAAASQQLVAEQQGEWPGLSRELMATGIDVIHDVAAAMPYRADLATHFVTQIFPILTPQALDPAHPFPLHPQQGAGGGVRSGAPERWRSGCANW